MQKIRVCCARSCATFGAESVMKTITDSTGLKPGEKNEHYDVDWGDCLGWCSNSPCVGVNDARVIMEADPKTIFQRIEKGEGKETSGDILELFDMDNFLGDL